ncbi:hypothetical protein K8089_10325 [Aequorivita sp. F47161]|uniref:Uncharacterized protein n=1 Tax=Aequorivita vitellina TaxID=2874475 RepID=A0A9X1U203_9FLAO|nr:hypothetical protein [Aequorivita vitellina]MCG2419420.1 hypothetical protein [Aequorivita vitellina]MCZ4318601.1 hypothetical protein [Aequorivita viscosa]
MQLHGLIHTLPRYVKQFIAAFVIVLSVGYFTGLNFVRQTDSTDAKGLVENYLGNEDAEDITVMKFKKGEREMLTILHTHILSISFIFFMLGGLVAITSLPTKLKAFLMIEPFASILLTFGGIYFMWKGMLWMKWIVMISGILMTVVYVVAAGAVLWQLIVSKKK